MATMPLPALRRRGRPGEYSDSLILKPVPLMVNQHVPTVHCLLAMLAEPTDELARVRVGSGRYHQRCYYRSDHGGDGGDAGKQGGRTQSVPEAVRTVVLAAQSAAVNCHGVA
jgi:hypothetical protein